ncbi:MAG: pyridoxal 5'-phosphate synthase glutaminase subunit PdxT, partial [Spirochaetia bacterium]|nr:pyridoxal 5'-phosphate synthase glutaminase subunit PdxT [Spirochaetia bacterium]
MRVGVLALQGGFREHIAMLEKLHVEGFEVRRRSDLDDGLDALIIPGGESTVIGKLLVSTHLQKPIKTLIDDGLPVFGTCAGMILLSSERETDESVRFSAIPITVQRNAYGRQLSSFATRAFCKGIGEIPMTFIRAPIISQ